MCTGLQGLYFQLLIMTLEHSKLLVLMLYKWSWNVLTLFYHLGILYKENYLRILYKEYHDCITVNIFFFYYLENLQSVFTGKQVTYD